MSKSNTESLPRYAVPTGDFIAEWMEDNGTNAADLARRLGVSRKHVSLLLRGDASLSPEMALRLERVTGVPARNWNNLEALYQEDRARLAECARLENGYETAAMFPLDYLRTWGFITAAEDDHATTVIQLLSFFHVGDVEALYDSWAKSAVVYRKTAASMPRREDLMTWLTAAERLVTLEGLPPFDQAGLESLLPDLNALPLDDPMTNVATARQMLTPVGVMVCLVPEIPGLEIYGATRWLHNHPLIQLSQPQHKGASDHLRFTLFHEIGHVIKHPRTKLYVQGTSEHEEEEADQFAAEVFASSTATEAPPRRQRQALTELLELENELGLDE